MSKKTKTVKKPTMWDIDQKLLSGWSSKRICKRYGITLQSLAAYKANLTRALSY
jgi:hypothetical protein